MTSSRLSVRRKRPGFDRASLQSMGAAPPYPPPPPSGAPIGDLGRELPRTPERLSPLSPVVRVGRASVAFAYIVATSVISRNRGDEGELLVNLAILGVVVMLGVVSWAVTTWSVEGDTVQVATGLIRREVVRLPLSRVQAVDVVEPWLARILGLAEVRLRTGGGRGADARLQYLSVRDAQAVRASLIAMVHGLPESTPEAVQVPLVIVDNTRLVVSSLISSRGITIAAFLAAEVALIVTHSTIAASTFVIFTIAALASLARQIANEWGLTASQAPDGLRIATGLGSRVRETIPLNRVQAVRQSEPLLWRPLGWYRLELHLAGGLSKRRNQPSSTVVRSLLPVGERRECEFLVAHLLGRTEVPLKRPPSRGRMRSLLSFHFLAAGHDSAVAAATSGRLRRRTEFVPLAKVQSIRYLQGPLLRALRLATVRIEAAGRDATVSFRQWDVTEAKLLVEQLAVLCAAAREAAKPSPS